MLARLKQSVCTAKELAQFFRKRATLEEDHAAGIRKLCRSTKENMHRADHREGSFRNAHDEAMAIHERLANNGFNFARTLHDMHNDLVELCDVAERHRKSWKVTGLSAEERVADFEQTTKKSKARYDALAEEYDRARTGDTRQGSKISIFKISKSMAQQEEELLRKVQGADQAYHGQAQALQSERKKLLGTTRPETVKALQELIVETDAVVSLHLHKYGVLCEKFVLSDGLVISPIDESAKCSSHRGLRDIFTAIDNAQDLTTYIQGQHEHMHPKVGYSDYIKHPVLSGTTSQHPAENGLVPYAEVTEPSSITDPCISGQASSSRVANQGSHKSTTTNQQSLEVASITVPVDIPPMALTVKQPPYVSSGTENSEMQLQPQKQHGQDFSQCESTPNRDADQKQHLAKPQGVSHSRSPSQGPPQLGALPFQSESNLEDARWNHAESHHKPYAEHLHHTPQQIVSGHSTLHPATNTTDLSSSKNLTTSSMTIQKPGLSIPTDRALGKMFCLSLAALYERDNNPIPLVVNQCIQAVELFGLSVEGIYRQSGSMNHINSMKVLFDSDPHDAALDFRRPDNFHHDINSVAGLLKQFFRDLPDPLLTQARYQEFIKAAQKDDEIVRRDMLHAIINGLDDPNYATLRALSLHLHRVSANKAVTRMDFHNLAVVFGPTLMGTNDNLADSGWQVRVIETILSNTHQIFDED
jgi:hypothetical protein